MNASDDRQLFVTKRNMNTEQEEEDADSCGSHEALPFALGPHEIMSSLKSEMCHADTVPTLADTMISSSGSEIFGLEEERRKNTLASYKGQETNSERAHGSTTGKNSYRGGQRDEGTHGFGTKSSYLSSSARHDHHRFNENLMEEGGSIILAPAQDEEDEDVILSSNLEPSLPVPPEHNSGDCATSSFSAASATPLTHDSNLVFVDTSWEDDFINATDLRQPGKATAGRGMSGAESLDFSQLMREADDTLVNNISASRQQTMSPLLEEPGEDEEEHTNDDNLIVNGGNRSRNSSTTTYASSAATPMTSNRSQKNMKLNVTTATASNPPLWGGCYDTNQEGWFGTWWFSWLNWGNTTPTHDRNMGNMRDSNGDRYDGIFDDNLILSGEVVGPDETNANNGGSPMGDMQLMRMQRASPEDRASYWDDNWDRRPNGRDVMGSGGAFNGRRRRRGAEYIRAVRTGEMTFQVSVHIPGRYTVRDVVDVLSNPNLLSLWCDPVRAILVTQDSNEGSEGMGIGNNRSGGGRGSDAHREYDGEWIEATTSTLVSPSTNTSCVHTFCSAAWTFLGFPSHGKITMFIERKRGQVGLAIGPFDGGTVVSHTLTVRDATARVSTEEEHVMGGFGVIVEDRVCLKKEEEDEAFCFICRCCGLFDVTKQCFSPGLLGYMEQVVSSMERLRFLVERGEVNAFASSNVGLAEDPFEEVEVPLLG